MTARQDAFPEPETDASEPFRVRSPREIAAILRDIRHRRVLVTLYYQGNERFIVSSLLSVDEAQGCLVFDPSQDAAVNDLIRTSRDLVFVAFIDQVKTQFTAAQAEAVRFEGGAGLRVRLPASILRLQRREFFRIAAPKGTPVQCEVPLPDGGRLALEVGDISVGGLAMLAGPDSGFLAAGTVLSDCRIELPGHGVVLASVELCNRVETSHAQVRLGCRFLNLGGTVENLIQRYINHVERSRRALS